MKEKQKIKKECYMKRRMSEERNKNERERKVE